MAEEQAAHLPARRSNLLAIAVLVEFVLIMGLGGLLYLKEFAPTAGGQQDSLVVVTAGEFRLVDDRDSTRAALLFDDQREPRLRLYDEYGTIRAALVLEDGNPALVLADSTQAVRCIIALDDYGYPSVAGYNTDSSQTFNLNTLYGSSSLSLYDGMGNLKTSLGWAGLNIYDSNGISRLRADVYSDIPSLKISNSEGQICANVSIGEYGPFFAVYDDDGVLRAAMTVGSSGAFISVLNSSGAEQATLGAGTTTGNGRVQTYTEGSLRLFDTRGQSTVILPVSYQ